jgi:hypothetical protein
MRSASLTPCPDDPGHTADEFLLGQLDQKAAEAFWRHVGECRSCAAATAEAREFIAALKATCGLFDVSHLSV